MKRLAAFDVDGTLVHGTGGKEYIKFLHEKEFIPFDDYRKAMESINRFIKGEMPYMNMVKALYGVYFSNIGKFDDKRDELADEFCKKNMIILPYAKDLVSLFDEKIVISGNTDEIVKYTAKKLGFVDNKIFAASLNGNDFSKEGEKKKVLKEYADIHSIDLNYSFAFGDTEHDIELFEEVGFPVPINPTNELRKYAEEKGWTCTGNNVVEKVRKMIK